MTFEALERFVVDSEIARRAGAPIRDGRELALQIEGPMGSAQEIYTFTRLSGQNVLKIGQPICPDATFIVQAAAAEQLISTAFESVGKAGLFVFENMLTRSGQPPIRVKLHVDFMELIRAGYLGVLAAGGADVAKFLASRGLTSLGRLRAFLARSTVPRTNRGSS